MKYCKKIKTLDEKDTYFANAENSSLPGVVLCEEDKKCYYKGQTYTVTCIGSGPNAGYYSCTVGADKYTVYQDDEDKVVSFSIYCRYGYGGCSVVMGGKDVTSKITPISQNDKTKNFSIEVVDDITVRGWARQQH